MTLGMCGSQVRLDGCLVISDSWSCDLKTGQMIIDGCYSFGHELGDESRWWLFGLDVFFVGD